MIANLMDAGRALEIADVALRDVQEWIAHGIPDDGDTVLLRTVRQLAIEVVHHADQTHKSLRAELILRQGEG